MRMDTYTAVCSDTEKTPRKHTIITVNKLRIFFFHCEDSTRSGKIVLILSLEFGVSADLS